MNYLSRRLLNTIILLIVLLAFVSLMGRLTGDLAENVLGTNATEQGLENFRASAGLNDPLWQQWGRYMSEVARGDLGVSYRYGFSMLPSDDLREVGTPVLPLVLERLPATFLLAGVAIAIAIVFSLGLGIVAAMRPGSWMDRIINVLGLGAVSIVQFWLGLMLIVVFALALGWFPTSGYGGWNHVILPALALSARPLGRISQIVRSSMLDELSKPYVVAAKARGASEKRIVVVHALKNAAMPIVTMVGDEFGALLTGAVLVETVFAWPGVGLLLFDSLVRNDLPLVQAAILVIAVIVITINFFVDLSYSALSPKVRMTGASS